jgi:hypothetical protein
MLGAAAPLRLLLARTDDVVIAITDATAYPSGFEFTLVVRSRARSYSPYDDPFELRHPGLWRHARPGDEIPPELLRFGIEFSDGSKATNLSGMPRFDTLEDEPPEGPVLVEHAGGGGGGEWESSYWVWPLPPEGPLAFVCEWPAKGIPLTREEIDAALVLGAAPRAEKLWDDGGGTMSGGWTSYGFTP